ncbi:PTS sugar transporter subunit IIA [Phyllobacterium sp. TAF24]|uniref:PTS sugar transporter subunit IIA n=1 Tax=Phyllobacterium sp. TAF24 TaxID=3233068 RepID=UPI003F9C9992
MSIAMKLADYIALESIVPDLDVSSKSQALQAISTNISPMIGVSADVIVHSLQKREELGSTGVGGGIAIPHARILGISKPIAAFAKLKKPIDFEAIDDLPVDIILALLTPDQAPAEHLNVLACFSRKLRSPDVLKRMRATRNAQTLLDCLVMDT